MNPKFWAGEAVPANQTRRAFLKSVPVAAVAASMPAVTLASATTSLSPPAQASPALLDALARFNAAVAEQAEAKDALQWLADEWRHRWPLAPEELLWGTNADVGSWRDTAERDIIGNYLYRDTSDLTRRLTARQRRETPRTCFSLQTAAEAQETVDAWTKRVPSGRTERALARNRAEREDTIREFTRKRDLALAYEAETTRLREAADVEGAKDRIGKAWARVAKVREEIARLPVTNGIDLAIKAQVLQTHEVVKLSAGSGGILGDLAALLQDAIDLVGEVSQ